MDDVHFHEREFELRYLKSRGTGFQDLFSELMERAHPADFQRVRPHGNAGDMKCDGYLRSARTVFQVYGPEEIRRVARLLAKIDDDFTGAVTNWGARMERWIFVHNSQGGLPAEAVQKLEALRAAAGAPQIEVWGFSEMLRLVRQLAPTDLRALFPVPVSTPGNQLPQLPQLEAARSYWEWLRGRAPVEESTDSITKVLRGLELPIRLLRPEDEATLRLHDERVERERQEDDWVSNLRQFSNPGHEKVEEFTITSLNRVLRAHSRLLVLGDAGSGKTTLLRRIAVAEAERLFRRGARKRSRRTPVLVSLWRFGSTRSLTDLLMAAVSEAGAASKPAEILAAMERGFVLALLDGADEVPTDLRRECFAQILTLSQQYPRCRFILTSRQLPAPPAGFHTLTIGPLRDEDIATAIAAKHSSTRAFRETFDGMTPSDYVRVKLRPAVRQLCRRPLTLALVLTAIAAEGDLPETLFKAYERFINWMLGWENQKDRLPTALGAIEALQETGYLMASADAVAVSLAEWTRAAGHALHRARSESGTSVAPDEVMRLAASTGLIRIIGGDVSFSHRSLQEYFAAKRLLARGGPVHDDPVSLKPGVARFLCGALDNVENLLGRHLERCNDAAALMPLLLEVTRAETYGGKFEALYNAIALGQEMGVELTHSMWGPKAETFVGQIDDLVETCVDFGPKTTSALTDAAHGIIFGAPWQQSREWFERIVDGLERLGWRGSRHHRRLVEIGFFEAVGGFCDDGTNADAAARLEQLNGYLSALHDEHWDRADEHLRAMADLIRRYEPPREDGPEKLPAHPREREDAALVQGEVAARRLGKKTLPTLPVVEQILRLDETSPTCPNCGALPGPMAEMYEHWRVVDFDASGYRTVRVKQQLYACCRARPSLDRTTPGSHYSLRFTVKVAVDRYRDHVRLSRQAQTLSEQGVQAEPSALWDELNALSRRLETVHQALLDHVLARPAIGLSETRVAISGRGRPGRFRLWCLAAPGAVVLRVRDDNGAEPVAMRLAAHRGIIVCDPLEMEELISTSGSGVIFAGSWAHVDVQLGGVEPHEPETEAARRLIDQLYQLEVQAGDDLETRARMRRSESSRVLKELRALMSSLSARATPSGKVAAYVMSNWDSLTRFVGDTRTMLDSYCNDRALAHRVPEIPRASKSRRATEVAATLGSLIETAKLNDIDPAAYLLAAVPAADRGEMLLPWQLR